MNCVTAALSAAVLYGWMVTAGCASPAAPIHGPEERIGSHVYIRNVPFYPQEAYQCGPASLAAVLNYWGHTVSPDEIARAVYSPRLKGTLGLDMWSYANGHQFEAQMRSASLPELYTFIRQGIPVIAFLDLGYQWFPVPHFVVVVGIDPDLGRVITYNGREYNSQIPYNTFMAAWKKTNYWTLVVEPKHEA
jgi:ABC-type bacteriocin/lantibiotic exporter with double-glycine peptidase domain